ncbi:T9SS type A sorting domain-containing protein [bacterium]|nr:MAG: T9SS type A sorting domain-containing protein [bacterium]
MKLISLAILFCIITFTNTFAQVDYASQIQPIFSANCTGCHGGTSGVTLNSYSAVMNSTGAQYGIKIVSPGNAALSPLVEKIKANPSKGGRMPQGGSLSSEQITLIETWINEGANSVPTSIEDDAKTPLTFALDGNYPNPFNPTTTIRFSMSNSATVLLQVYSIRGNLVLTKNAQFGSGSNQIPVDLHGLASGTYLYTLTAHSPSFGIQRVNGKMLLIK